MSDFPFEENRLFKNLFLREFKEGVDDEELIWHQDREDRIVTVLESNNWKLQLDDELPIAMEEGKCYNIPAYVYHRVIKGSGNLKIIVEKKK